MQDYQASKKHFTFKLFRALNLPTLVYHRIRGDMFKTLNIPNNINDSRVTISLKGIFFTTRGHILKLFVQHANFNIRKWFISICIVDIWNHLPSSVVNASNVMCFEKRFNKCWADLKIEFYDEAPLIYSEFNYNKINAPQNIHFDGELSVVANAI